MSLIFDADNKGLSIAFNASQWTVLGWAKLAADVNRFTTIFDISVSTGTNGYMQFATNSGGVLLGIHMSSSGLDSISLVPGTWYRVAVRKDATQFTLSVATATGALAHGTLAVPGGYAPTTLRIGRSVWSGEPWNGPLTGFKVYTAKLSDAEIATEFTRPEAFRTADLWATYALDAPPGTADTSGNSRTLTSGGVAPSDSADLPPYAAVTTYYVAANGNDANPGTQAQPWQTLNPHYSVTFAPGDRLLLRGGDTFTGLVYIAQAGTAANPIIVGSYGTGRATITNTSNSGVYVEGVGGVRVENLNVVGGVGAAVYDGVSYYKSSSGRAAHVRVTNCTISGWKNGVAIGGATGGGFSDVLVSGCDLNNNRDSGLSTYGPQAPGFAHSDVTVSDCRAWDNEGNAADTVNNTGSGIILGSVDVGLVDLCAAWSNGALCTAPEGPVGIWCYDANAVIMQRSVSYDNKTGGPADGDGFDIDIRSSNCVIQYCLSYGNDGAGILVYALTTDTIHTGNVVRYNLCWGNSRKGDFYYAELTVAGNIGNFAAYNNTLISRDNGAISPPALSIENGAVGATIRNNILCGQSGLIVRALSSYATSAVLMQGNNYFNGTGIKWGSTTYTSLGTWRSAVAGQEKNGAVNTGGTVNPELVDPTVAPTVTNPSVLTGADGLRLGAASPLDDAGLDLPTLFGTSVGTRDYFGTSLTSPYSIGGHESEGPPLSSPATILDIGTGAAQNHFKLQVARTGDGAVLTKTLAELVAGYTESPYWYTTSDGLRVHTEARLDAPTTAGTLFSRCELRETDAAGADYSWDPTSGEHVMEGTTTITSLPPVKPDVVIAQIFHEGTTADIASIRTQLVSGTIRLRFRFNGVSVTSPQMASPYATGTEFSWKLRVVGGVVEVYWAFGGALPATPQITTAAIPAGQCYFKAGLYNQSNVAAGDAGTAIGASELRALNVEHTTALTLRRNVCYNPSVEVNDSGYVRAFLRSAVTATGAVRVADGAAAVGTNHIRVQCSNATGGTSTSSDFDVTVPRASVVEGVAYTFSCHSKHDVVGPDIRWYLRWENESGTNLGVVNGVRTPLTTAWDRYALTATAPAGATRAFLQVWVYGVVHTATQSWRLDGLLYEPSSSLGSYGDGTVAGWAWDGVAHNSLSRVVVDAPDKRLAPIFGLDVNHFRTGLNLATAQNEGMAFAIAKIGQGSSTAQGFGETLDASWVSFRNAALAIDMPFAGYWYLGDTEAPSSQAQRCRDYLGDLGVPVILDWELGGGTWSNVVACVNAFRAVGLTVRMLYTRASFYSANGGGSLSDLNLALWNARYPVTTGGTPQALYENVKDNLDAYWQSYGGVSTQIMQYSDNSTIATMTPVDANAFYGDEADLAVLFDPAPQGTPGDSGAFLPFFI